MRSRGAIELEGEVVDVLSSRLARVKLRNGHHLMAFLTRRDQLRKPALASGEMVKLELWPCDFSKGRIRIEHES